MPKYEKEVLVEFSLKELTTEDGVKIGQKTILRLDGVLDKSKAELVKETLDKQIRG